MVTMTIILITAKWLLAEFERCFYVILGYQGYWQETHRWLIAISNAVMMVSRQQE
jgi:hypothetical protein